MIQLVGEYVSQYARDFIEKYCEPNGTTKYVSCAEATWSGGSFGSGTFNCCCTAGVKYMYELALGVNIYDLGFASYCGDAIPRMKGEYSENWIDVTNQELQPGDIVIVHNGSHSHTEMYIGNNENANFGNSPNSGKVTNGPRLGSEFEYAFRLDSSIDVDPSGKVSGTGVPAGKQINYSKFFFNGIPDGKYSLATKKSLIERVIDALSQLINYITGLLTYLFRGVIISFISVFDRLLNNTIDSIDVEIPKMNEENKGTVIYTNTDDSQNFKSGGITATNSDDPISMHRSVTIESLIFNKLELFDINIFK